ncbi:MAG: hypothetical protein HOE48_20960 [Candidatus Latescibacteria bacterium]|nr:hypothetical protein [Candidatus Latescibacterota bacterium]MBT5832600.1 hypothetical protein [Candidatus Latescibacterota bacterium]
MIPNLEAHPLVGGPLCSWCGVDVWVEGRVEREVGVGTARAGEGGFRS